MILFRYVKETFQSPLLVKNMLLGTGIGLALIGLFLFNTDEPNPDWHELWMIRPFVIVPFAGAMGGLFFTFMEPWRRKTGWTKAGAYLLCLLVFLIGLFMGIVLGLDGTYWN